MYIPKHFEQKDWSKAIEFVQQHPFGLLISNDVPSPIATHLPFIVREEDNKVYLISHLAKANPQTALLKEHSPLVVFSEPHAYISPKHYTRESVPTWNYVAVHIYGSIEIISDNKSVLDILEQSIHFFDKSYQKEWQQPSEKYINGLLQALVAFRIEVTAIQAKEKLSQNRNTTEKKNIIEGLLSDDSSTANSLGKIMQKRYEL